MITELKPDLDRSVSRRFATLADDSPRDRTAAALEANGITVFRAADAAEAKQLVLDLIPDGSRGLSRRLQTLEVNWHHRRDREVRPL